MRTAALLAAFVALFLVAPPLLVPAMVALPFTAGPLYVVTFLIAAVLVATKCDRRALAVIRRHTRAA